MKLKLFFVILLLFVMPVQAQDSDSGYPDIRDIGCADLAPNEICYGQAAVELLVDCEEAPEFDTPDERLSLEAVCLIRTSADGVALMRLEPGADSVFLAAVGDVEIQNVSSGEVGQDAVLETDADIYSGPGSQYEVIGSLAAGTEVYVNACNCTRNWLRIMQADGSVGWIPARRVSVDDTALPEVAADAPVYTNLQAITLVTGASGSGLLIQMLDAPVLLQINGVQLDITSTVFVRSIPGNMLEIDVLDGHGRFTANETTVHVPAGGHLLVPLSERNVPVGEMTVALYESDHASNLPLALLPQAIDPLVALDAIHPAVVSVEECDVVSNRGDTACPLQFVNPDGDAIVQMDVEFVYAPMGTWEGSQNENPTLLEGDMRAGVLSWTISCSLAGENFIGPVQWLITLEDAAGNRSAPFEAAFNCVDG